MEGISKEKAASLNRLCKQRIRELKYARKHLQRLYCLGPMTKEQRKELSDLHHQINHYRILAINNHYGGFRSGVVVSMMMKAYPELTTPA